jgi:hypothetical protein
MSHEQQKEADALAALSELETGCPCCKGNPEYNGNPCGPWRPCGTCDGVGYIPTEFGEKELALVRRNLRLDSGTEPWQRLASG